MPFGGLLPLIIHPPPRTRNPAGPSGTPLQGAYVPARPQTLKSTHDFALVTRFVPGTLKKQQAVKTPWRWGSHPPEEPPAPQETWTERPFAVCGASGRSRFRLGARFFLVRYLSRVFIDYLRGGFGCRDGIPRPEFSFPSKRRVLAR